MGSHLTRTKNFPFSELLELGATPSLIFVSTIGVRGAEF